MAPRPKRPLWRRALRLAGYLLGSPVVLAVALLVAVELGSNLPFARRFAVREINHVLAPLFKGKIVLENVASLHLGGVGGVDVRVEAPDGTTVIQARGVRGRIAPIALVESLLRHRELRIDVFDCDADSVEVNLDTDDSGALKLAAAFEPAHPSPPPAPGAPPGPAIHLEFPHLAARHTHAHGQIKGAPPLDSDLDSLLGSVRVLPDRTTVDVVHVEVTARGMPQGANPHGTIQAHLEVPSAEGAVIEASGSFVGDVGGIPTTAKGAVRGDRLDAVLDVPEVAADKIRALVAQAPIYQAGAAHAEAHGQFASLAVTAHAKVGAGLLDARGTVALTGRLGTAVALDLRNVDLRAFGPTAPRSSIDLHTDVHADTGPDGLLSGTFNLDVPQGGSVAGQSIPLAAFQGDFNQRPGDAGFAVETSGSVSEPGAPIKVQVHARTGKPAPVVDFVVSSQIDRLADVRRVGGLGPGSANVRVAGVVTLSAEPSFDAALDADVVGLVHGAVRVDRAKLQARGFGPLSSPTLNGALEVSRGTTDMRASVDQIRGEAGRLDVEGVSITGLGEPVHGNLHVRPQGVAVQADSKGLELKSLGYLFGIENELREGRLAFAVDFSGQRSGAKGTAALDMKAVCVGQVDGLSGNIDLSMDDRKVQGSINAAAEGIGALKVTKLDLEVGGRGPLDSASWRRTWGTLEIDGQADLVKVVALLPPNSLPFAIVAGQVALKGRVERDTESDVTPDVTLSLKTSNLVLSPQSAPDEKGTPTLAHAQGWQMVGVDVQVDAAANGKTGAITLDTRLVDRHGEIASLEAKSAAIPYGPLLASSEGAAARMLNVAVSATITVPTRKLAELPDLLRPEGASGDVEGSITIEGTCLKPRVDAHVKAQSVKFDSSPLLTPLDADITAKYDGSRGEVVLDVRSGSATLLNATAQADAKVGDVLAGATNGTPWDASAKATLTHFPLESIAPLADRHLHGKVSGHFELTGLHKDARATADFDLEGLRVAKVKYGAGKVTVGYDGHALSAKLHLDQEGGFANAEAKLGVLWGANPAPSLDPAGSMEASLQAKHFSAAFLQPFMQSTVDEIDGTVDADAQISSSAGKKPEMKGSVVLSNGVVEPIALGQEFRAVNAKVTFTPDGVVKLESMSAQGTGGKVTASGVARVDGTVLVGAQATVNIAKRDAMPLDVQGANLGTVYGQFVLKATTSGDRKTMNLDMDVPSLHVLLPEASTHSVQDLDEPPSQVHVGVYASADRFVTLPIDGAMVAASKEGPPETAGNPLTVVVHLGKDVEIRRGTDIRVTLDGSVTAKLSKNTEVTGQIRLLGGKLDVQGKSFEIETGTVTFVGDPGNPLIKVTAGWTAEDGTRVFADYVGPLKTGKVTLRSEPARPKNEIVALILFGTADGSQATPYATPQPDVATRAGTTVGGMATAGLSKGLDKLTGMDITTKIDTSQQNPRPEVEVQVAKDISLQLAFVIGQPPPGTNPDTTYATIDWRFARSWSLETTFGDQGSSMADVVWQHRY